MVVIAAIALVLRASVAGFIDAAAASPLLDIFGNVICVVHGGEQTPASPALPGNHSPLPECCLAGCALGGGHVAPASLPAFLPPPSALLLKLKPVSYRCAIARIERTPLNARAPPVPA